MAGDGADDPGPAGTAARPASRARRPRSGTAPPAGSRVQTRSAGSPGAPQPPAPPHRGRRRWTSQPGTPASRPAPRLAPAGTPRHPGRAPRPAPDRGRDRRRGTDSAYAGLVPADLVLVCGVFGNSPTPTRLPCKGGPACHLPRPRPATGPPRHLSSLSPERTVLHAPRPVPRPPWRGSPSAPPSKRVVSVVR